jgi:hypothetical protein
MIRKSVSASYSRFFLAEKTYNSIGCYVQLKERPPRKFFIAIKIIQLNMEDLKLGKY